MSAAYGGGNRMPSLDAASSRRRFLDDFTKPPGSMNAFLNYDRFVTTEGVVKSSAPALKGFLAAYHDKGLRCARISARASNTRSSSSWTSDGSRRRRI